MGLFSHLEPKAGPLSHPLADRMRPDTLDEFVGQEHILAPGKPLRRQIEKDQVASLILWGPPGSGKTTDRKSTRLNSSHIQKSRMPSSA